MITIDHAGLGDERHNALMFGHSVGMLAGPPRRYGAATRPNVGLPRVAGRTRHVPPAGVRRSRPCVAYRAPLMSSGHSRLQDPVFVGNVARHTRQELQDVHYLTARGGTGRLAGAQTPPVGRHRWVFVTSCSGNGTKLPSGRNPPSVTSRCKCGCELAREPWVWMDATMPTERSRSPGDHGIPALHRCRHRGRQRGGREP